MVLLEYLVEVVVVVHKFQVMVELRVVLEAVELVVPIIRLVTMQEMQWIKLVEVEEETNVVIAPTPVGLEVMAS